MERALSEKEAHPFQKSRFDLQDVEPAATKALRLPEIVSSVFQALSDICPGYPQTLLSCSVVNKTWNREANRYLWQKICSTSHGENHIPTLSALSRIESDRRQGYANFVQEVHIIYRATLMQVPVLTEKWLSQINTLSYPRLQRLNIGGFESLAEPTRQAFTDNQIALWRPFLQPSLRELKLQEILPRTVISDAWLLQISRFCRSLRRLTCVWHYHYAGKSVEMMPTTIKDVLEASSHSLEEILWYDSLSMSSTCFKALSQCSKLRRLRVPQMVIRQDWLEHPEFRMVETAFPALKYLDCAISGNVFQSFSSFLSRVRVLDLKEEIDSLSLWNTITKSALKNLKRLRLYLEHGDQPDAKDLLSFVSNNPHLEILKINGSVCNRSIKNLNDEFIEDMAKSLPSLSSFDFLLSGNTSLTEQSIISLGKHCPLLKLFRMNVDVDWDRLFSNIPLGMWQKLEHIQVCIQYGPEREVLIDEIHEDNIQFVAGKMAEFMPSLPYQAYTFPPIVYEDVYLQELFQEYLLRALDERYPESARDNGTFDEHEIMLESL